MDTSDDKSLQEQIDELISKVAANRDDIAALVQRADDSDLRAAASESRADAADKRAEAGEARADASEAQALIDRDMIAELRREGVLSKEHAARMEHALKSSRVVGSAIGFVMGSRNVSEAEAFEVLKTASQHSNRKLRDIAAELLRSANNGTP